MTILLNYTLNIINYKQLLDFCFQFWIICKIKNFKQIFGKSNNFNFIIAYTYSILDMFVNLSEALALRYPNIQLYFHCKNYRIQKYTIITALCILRALKDVRKVDTNSWIYRICQYITLRIGLISDRNCFIGIEIMPSF